MLFRSEGERRSRNTPRWRSQNGLVHKPAHHLLLLLHLLLHQKHTDRVFLSSATRYKYPTGGSHSERHVYKRGRSTLHSHQLLGTSGKGFFDDLVYPQHLLGWLQIIREVLPLLGSNARLKWVGFSLDGYLQIIQFIDQIQIKRFHLHTPYGAFDMQALSSHSRVVCR